MVALGSAKDGGVYIFYTLLLDFNLVLAFLRIEPLASPIKYTVHNLNRQGIVHSAYCQSYACVTAARRTKSALGSHQLM